MIDQSRPTAVTGASVYVGANRHWFLGLGATSTLLGLAAIIFPFTAALTIELLVGWILLLTGVFGLIHAWRSSQWQGVRFSIVSSSVALVIGMLLVLFPRAGILSLALLVSLFFIISGIMRVMTAWRLKPLDRWQWLLLSGAAALVMGVLILMLWPQAAGWVIGILLGIDLLFSGLTLILIWVASERART